MTRYYRSNSVRLVLVPALFYGAIFVAVTYPLIFQFSYALWSGSPDGWQSIWNLWWVNNALTMLHQTPWFTTYAHFPYGVSLWGHTLEIFDGFLALPLAGFFSLIQIYNLLLVFSFIVGGLTAFWLAFYLTHAYFPALAAGYLFSFSNYHLAQARAHLNLASLQWIPLFILFWYLVLQKAKQRYALAAAVTLGVIALTDFYYLFYCVLAAVLMTVWWIWQPRRILWRKEYFTTFGVFAISALVFVVPFVAPLAFEFAGTQVQGHNAEKYSLDLTALVFPGRLWQFAFLTRDFWTKWSGNNVENNVALGLAVLVLLGYVWVERRKLGRADVSLWFLLGGVFVCLSLGPVLHIYGEAVPFLPMPYALLVSLIPALTLAGIPIRMMVMVVLSAAVLCAFGFQRLAVATPLVRWAAVVLFGLMVVESLQKPFSTMSPAVPPYVQALAALPAGSVVDWVGMDVPALNRGIPPGKMMYYQTIHQKPIALGYIARISPSTAQQDAELWAAILARRLDELCRRFQLRYFVADAKVDTGSEWEKARVVYKDRDVIIYDMNADSACSTTTNPP